MLLIKEFFGKMFCRYFFSNLKSHIFAFPKFTNLIYSITIIFFLEKMTKADIVNEIAKNTGIGQSHSIQNAGGFYGLSCHFFGKGRECLSPRLW